MAFEDRCSPNQANSPGPIPNKVPTSPNPTDRPLKPYTCSIITPKHERPSSPVQYNRTTIASPSQLEEYKNAQNLFYHPYYNGLFGLPRPLEYGLSIYEPFNYQQPRELPQRQEMRQDDTQENLNFSISNILRPEFGSNAIKRTNKKEGPKSGGPTQSILYKPYEPAKEVKIAPLGKLTNTVASIPQIVNKPVDYRSKDDFQRRPDSANSSISTASSSVSSQGVANQGSDDNSTKNSDKSGNSQWPAWVFCTRYSDRPSSGPRSRRSKKNKAPSTVEDKRPRTAFSGSQLARLKQEFTENRYLTEKRRQQLSAELGLNEAQIKIWFQNKRAKIKKSTGQKNPLALQLMAQGLYNHTTASCSEDEDEIKVT